MVNQRTNIGCQGDFVIGGPHHNWMAMENWTLTGCESDGNLSKEYTASTLLFDRILRNLLQSGNDGNNSNQAERWLFSRSDPATMSRRDNRKLCREVSMISNSNSQYWAEGNETWSCDILLHSFGFRRFGVDEGTNRHSALSNPLSSRGHRTRPHMPVHTCTHYHALYPICMHQLQSSHKVCNCNRWIYSCVWSYGGV